MNVVFGRNTGPCTRRCYEKMTQYNHHLPRLSAQPLRKKDVGGCVLVCVCAEVGGGGGVQQKELEKYALWKDKSL